MPAPKFNNTKGPTFLDLFVMEHGECWDDTNSCYSVERLVAVWEKMTGKAAPSYTKDAIGCSAHIMKHGPCPGFGMEK